MKILKGHTLGPDGRTRSTGETQFFHQDFEQFEGRTTLDFDFISATVNFDSVGDLFFQPGRKVVYLEYEEPNRFFLDMWFNHYKYDDKFYKVLSICPYTTEWLNKKYNNRILVFTPLSDKYAPSPTTKKYDVAYCGQIFNGEITKIISDISKFNYRLISSTKNPIVTNYNVSHIDKLRILAESKISVVHNLLFLADCHISNIKTIKDYHQNNAFSRLNDKIAPQIKGRTFEAAFCRSLILCRKDPWNVIERYFTPDREFIYYEPGTLPQTMNNILKNYGDYQKIIDAAFERAMSEYTTTCFFNKYLKNLT